jgi:hypothetical protein
MQTLAKMLSKSCAFFCGKPARILWMACEGLVQNPAEILRRSIG